MATDISFDKIIISKARKIDNTYICPIYYHVKNEHLQLKFTNVYVISLKPLKQRNEFILDFKNKNYCNFLFDLNAHIINIVKEKSSIWFNNNMNIDLIDDYYSNPLLYDKNNGDIIRLKCIGSEDNLKEKIGHKIDITIQFNQLKFYKQKFLVECEIINYQDVNVNCEIIENEEEYQDEFPEPTADDINIIKNTYIKSTDAYLNNLKIMINSFEAKINEIEIIKDQLSNTKNNQNIINMCNDLEKICE
jgi:hypothetical protein